MNLAWTAVALALLGSATPASCWAVLSEPETVCDAAGTWRLSLSEAIGTALCIVSLFGSFRSAQARALHATTREKRAAR